VVAQHAGAAVAGTVFELVPSNGGWSERVLHRFRGGSDGSYPLVGLKMGGKGALYGTTVFDGNGFGTVFQLKRSKAGRLTNRVIYAFTGGNDGSQPYSGLISDAKGNLYGMTAEGQYGGTAFELHLSSGKWIKTLLYNLGGAGGAFPIGELALRRGNLYGTTNAGGGYGYGTVFELQYSQGSCLGTPKGL
jgi:hypothetical protein